jgi:hypothetical protein
MYRPLQITALAVFLVAGIAPPVIASPPAGFRHFEYDIFHRWRGKNIGDVDVFLVDNVAISRDGKTLHLIQLGVAEVSESLVLSCNVGTGKSAWIRLKRRKDEETILTSSSISRDGDRITAWPSVERDLVTEKRPCYFAQWTLRSGSVVREMRLLPSASEGFVVHAADFEGRTLLLLHQTSSETRYRIWDPIAKTTSGFFVTKPENNYESSEIRAAFTPDGKCVAIQSERSIQIVDVESMKSTAALSLSSERTDFEGEFQFSPDGKLLAAVVNDGGDRVVIWNTSSGQQIGAFESRPLPKNVEHPLTEEHRSIASLRAQLERLNPNRNVREILEFKRKEARALRRSAKHREMLNLGPFSADGRLIAVGRRAEVVVLDTETGKPIETLEVGRHLDEQWAAKHDRPLPGEKRPPANVGDRKIYDDLVIDHLVFNPDAATILLVDHLTNITVFPVGSATKAKLRKADMK